jgi:hypothetical protein
MHSQVLVILIVGLLGFFVWSRHIRRQRGMAFHEKYGGMVNPKAMPVEQPLDLQSMVDQSLTVRSLDIGNVSLPRTPNADDLGTVRDLLESKGRGRVDGITIVRSSSDIDNNIWYDVDAVVENLGATRFIIVKIKKTGETFVVSAQETALHELPYGPADALPYEHVTTTVPSLDYSKYA